jgi:hypothetical protein
MKRAKNGAILNFDLCDLQKSNKKNGYYVMYPYYNIYTYDKNLEMIQPLVQA